MEEVWEGKKYELYESTNFDEYMCELGLDFVTRLYMNNSTPIISLERNGDVYKLTTKLHSEKSFIEFELGKALIEVTLDGHYVKSVLTMEGNKLIHKQRHEQPTIIIHEFGATELITTMIVGDLICTRKYRVK